MQLTQQTEDQEIILQCEVLGLYPEEKDIQIMFNDQKELFCHEWPLDMVHTNNGPYTHPINNGKGCELHIPNPEERYDGEYFCRAKIHIHEQTGCVYLLSDSICITQNKTEADETITILAITVSICGTIVIVAIAIAVIICTCKLFRARCKRQKKGPSVHWKSGSSEHTPLIGKGEFIYTDEHHDAHNIIAK